MESARDKDPAGSERAKILDMPQTPLALIRAQGTGILGEYNHVVEIPRDHDFTIIYGPNGVGKTKFLEIVHAASNLDGRSLCKQPFDSVELTYSDGSVLQASRLHVAPHTIDAGRGNPAVRFQLATNGRSYDPWDYTDDTFQEWLGENTPWRQVNEDFWEDLSDGEVIHISELERRFPPTKNTSLEIPEYLAGFAQQTRAYLIETQRLRAEQQAVQRRLWRHAPNQRGKSMSRIYEQAETMRGLINSAQTEHSRITQQLDRTFPHRILSSPPTRQAEDAAIRQRYNDQNEFRSRLGLVAAVSLEDALSLPDRELSDWEQQLLNLYLDDADKKLAPFETLLQKIELLESIIGNRLLNKRLQVTAGEGLRVVHRDQERRLDLDSLSSGEQHEIILMFHLLFNVPPGSIVLIDEPEISLHVVWQLGFIPDVKRIAELAGFRFVVATHSPQIINDAWDRAVRLGPPEAQFT